MKNKIKEAFQEIDARLVMKEERRGVYQTALHLVYSKLPHEQ